MAVTLILPNGAEVSSGPDPYCMSDAEARAAWAKGAGPAVAAAAHAEAAQLATQLAFNASPEALAKALGLPPLGPLAGDAETEERHRLLVDMARRARGRALTREPLALLHQRGSLPTESLRAGQEIARVFVAIASTVTPRVTASYAGREAAGPRTDEWSVSLRTAYRDRYIPWRAWAGMQPVRKRGSRETLGDLTLLVAGEGHGPDEAALAFRMHRQTVVRRLQESLWWYALHAGWAQEVRAEQAA
jgi:hypothetical protein